MSEKYIRPDLNAMRSDIGVEDLLRAATLLRLAATPTCKGKQWLPEHVAAICATRGRDEAVMWLDGYWYATGVRHHDVVVPIQQILMLDGSVDLEDDDD